LLQSFLPQWIQDTILHLFPYYIILIIGIESKVFVCYVRLLRVGNNAKFILEERDMYPIFSANNRHQAIILFPVHFCNIGDNTFFYS
jgi:hypothetical protein